MVTGLVGGSRWIEIVGVFGGGLRFRLVFASIRLRFLLFGFPVLGFLRFFEKILAEFEKFRFHFVS